MCHSINSSGMDYEEANNIVELLTEINEHFKETFKKFGVMTIGSEISGVVQGMAQKVERACASLGPQEVEKITSSSNLMKWLVSASFVQVTSSLALLIPIFFACYRAQVCRRMINKVRIKIDDIKVRNE